MLVLDSYSVCPFFVVYFQVDSSVCSKRQLTPVARDFMQAHSKKKHVIL